MPKIKQFKDNNNTTYDIYGQNVKTLDWDDYSDLPSAQKNSDTAFFVPDAPSGITLIPQTVPDLPADIASFSDGADDEPLAKLEVGIEAVQSGSGEPSPSNVRPISGWTGAQIGVRGINQWDEEWELGVFNNTTGTKTPSNSNIRSKNYIRVLPNTDYYVLFTHSSVVSGFAVCLFYDFNGKFLTTRSVPSNGAVITTHTRAYYMAFYIATAYGTTYKNDISINNPSTDTDYHAYNGTTYTIQLGDTYYDCTLDVTSGLLTVDGVKIEADETKDWRASVTYLGAFYLADTAITPRPLANSSAICSHAKSINSVEDYAYGSFLHNTAMNVWIMPSTASVQDWKDYIVQQRTNGTPIEFKYKLATPFTVQLTPTQVKSLLKDNNIWADSGQIIDCTYYKYGQGTKPQLYFNDTVYEGSEVIANPEDATPYTKLDTVYINGITYDINLHGQSHIVDKLYEASDGDGAPLNTDISYLNSHTLSEYDYITVCLCDPTTFAQGGLTQVNSFTADSLSISGSALMPPVGLVTKDGECFVNFKESSFYVVSQSGSTGYEPSVYSIYGVMGSGNKVEGNPEGSATETLEKIRIDDTIYDVPDVTITPETITEPKQKIADFEIDGASGSLYAPIVVVDGHASGAIATFADGGDNKPLKSLKVAINPIQSGSGAPSPNNNRPISGWTGAEIERTGKNLFDNTSITISDITFNSTNGEITRNGFFYNLPAGTYTISMSGTFQNYIYLNVLQSDGTFVSRNVISGSDLPYNNRTFTLNKGDYIAIYKATSGQVLTLPENVQIEIGSTATAYEPYNGTTYPITWSEAGEMFGGILDVTSGVLQDTRTILNASDIGFTGSLVPLSDGTGSYLQKNNVLPIEDNNVISNVYTKKTSGVWEDLTFGEMMISARRVILTFPPTVTTTAEANTYLSTINAKLLITRYEPIEYHITPTPITTLLGNNNLWSDTGEIEECVYQRDINLVINQFDARITALEQALSGTRSLSLSKSAVKEEETKEEPKEEEKTKEEQR